MPSSNFLISDSILASFKRFNYSILLIFVYNIYIVLLNYFIVSYFSASCPYIYEFIFD